MINRQTVLNVHRILARAYGPLPRIGRGDPLGQLVETILSQNTTDKNSHRAYLSLRRHFPEWPAVLNASDGAVAASIRQGGLANIKAPRIKNVLRIVREREGSLSLRRLSRMSNAEAMEYLTSLPGVGVKTAACVLLFTYRRPVMPVDTHVYRVTRRLGWIDANVKVEDAGAIIARHVPDRLMLDVHVCLVWHGRRTCRARNPLCGPCPISRFCRTFRRAS